MATKAVTCAADDGSPVRIIPRGNNQIQHIVALLNGSSALPKPSQNLRLCGALSPPFRRSSPTLLPVRRGWGRGARVRVRGHELLPVVGRDGPGRRVLHDRMIGEGLVAFATVFVSTKAARPAPFVTASTAAASDSG